MIPFIDLKTQQIRIRSKIEERIKVVLDHGQYILGPEVKELEKKLSVFSNDTRLIYNGSRERVYIQPLTIWQTLSIVPPN